jgi:isoleucyl-tRNA synthetase
MPFAQWGYPHKPGSVEKFQASYPADFIAEAIDQTRGWFYTLMTIGTLVFDKSSYETVLCLGHILDKDGRKMSKHLGNVLEPVALMDQHGADAVRWYMLAAGSPWSARRVGHDAISDVVRKTLLTYWNTVSFYTLYADAAGFVPDASATQSTITLDRWINSELNSLITGVDKAYAAYDSQEAGKLIAAFIDDLSNWYVRRSRRRFWDGDAAALQTLYTALKELTLLMSPMVPFITEHVWQELIRPNEKNIVESVHLSTFPVADSSVIDQALSNSVQLSRRLVELGRAARAESKIKIRQPLSRALVAASGWSAMNSEIREHIADELNVLDLADISSAGTDLVSVSIKANFKSIGARYGADVQPIATAIHQNDAEALVRTLRSEPSVTIEYAEKKRAEISLEDVIITETPKSGWSVASHGGESLALDLELTDQLIAAGLTREIIRAIQEKRKNDGLNISDRINVLWNGPADVVAVMKAHENEIAAEVLAVSFTRSEDTRNEASEIGLWLELNKAQS